MLEGMTTRLVLADQSEAHFYDVDPIGGALRRVGAMSDPKAQPHLAAHHSSRSEVTPQQHEAMTFAHQIVRSLESARNAHEFSQLVVIAGPHFIGLLREAMPKPLAALIVAEIVKDLLHETEDAIRSYLPVTVASAKAHLPT